jgi:phage shock protein C
LEHIDVFVEHATVQGTCCTRREVFMAKRLYKIEAGRKLFGVCGGLAEYFNIDVVLVRIVWLVFALFYGAGILLYFVAALVLPNKSEIEV